MAQFLKYLLASILGVLIGIFLLFSFGSLVLAGLANQVDKTVTVQPNTMLHLKFNEPIPELTNNLELTPLDLQNRKFLGLHEIIRTIERARDDEDIKGIFLETEALSSTGIATATQLRNALLDFKNSGKFIIAYSKYYTQGAYYLATAGDEIYINPLGLVDFRGFAAQIPFFKDMLDKVGVKMEIFYAGKFKSATEPYRRSSMSEENRYQTRVYLEAVYQAFLEEIGRSRNIEASKLRELANNYEGGAPETAVETGLIDGIRYRDEILGDLRIRLGLDDDEKIPTISLKAYHRSNPPSTDYSIRDKVAVVYAEGSILDGEGENGIIGDARYTSILRKLRKNDDIKAIVLRVNSPGGSAMASENIWREVMLARQAGKPVIASMGDYAASGGYYIACGADTIIAEPKTLTGSIGVFLMIPNATELLNDKIGINFDSVKTSDMAAGISPFFDLTNKEQRYIQQRTNYMYETFLARVAEGRGISRDSAHEIAQGRVWIGSQALQIGLVDRLGDLEDAIQSAAAMAGLEQYRISQYPRVKDPLTELLEELMGQEEEEPQAKIATRLLEKELPAYRPYIRLLKEVTNSKGAQARLPFVIPFD